MKNKTHSLTSILCLLAFLLCACSSTAVFTPVAIVNSPTQSVSAPKIIATPTTPADSVLTKLDGQYEFTEGPAVDQSGNVYFSDINAGKIYQWSTGGGVTLFLDGLNQPNGLAFDAHGRLIVCEGGAGRLIAIDARKQITVLADQYNRQRFNAPNDLWIDPQGGIYFSDPAYGTAVVQDGEHVYYLSPDRARLIRVIDDLVRPNGLVGTLDGKTLYVADHGAGQTFVYRINADGTLSNKRLFASSGSDGLELDASGNLYLTTSTGVQIYSATGHHLLDISVPETPTNVAFGGANREVLFITARTAVYIVANVANDSAAKSTFTLTSPDVIDNGTLPVEYTCDGASSTLALAWSGAPIETKSFAVIMHHAASPTDIHWYWVLYNIPSNVTSLPKNMTGIGTLGTNSVNKQQAYTPPCSKGPGPKEYIYTVYALSAQPQFAVPANQIERATLLEAISNITLDRAELHVIYSRK